MGEYNRISLEKLRIFLKIVKTPYIPYKASNPPTFPLRKVIFPVGIPYNLHMAKIRTVGDFLYVWHPCCECVYARRMHLVNSARNNIAYTVIADLRELANLSKMFVIFINEQQSERFGAVM